MLKELVEAVQDGVKTETIELRGRTYATREVYLPPDEKRVRHLTVNSLTGLIDYLNKNVDSHDADKIFIHIEDAKTVKVYEQVFSKEGDRQLWIEAHAKLQQFRFGSHFTQEDFITSFQSLFVDSAYESNDYAGVLNYVSNVSAADEVQNSDSGVTQEIVLKTGIRKSETEIKNPVTLAPIRTFTEVEQPFSPFILRMNKRGETITTALFEGDNGKWENEARANIKEFLLSKLTVDVPILA